MQSFFKQETTQPATLVPIIESESIADIFSKIPDDSLLVLDIDETTGRVSQMMGLDFWFCMRREQFINDGHDKDGALQKAVELYNLAQLASTSMVAVEPEFDIGAAVEALKKRGVKIIGLTARDKSLADKTLDLLKKLNVTFSDGVLNDGTFELNNRLVQIKDGVIFADGNHKGECLLTADKLRLFNTPLSEFPERTFVDDSERNCKAVAESLGKQGVSCKVYHYRYAEKNHNNKFDANIAARQEQQLLEDGTMLTDEQARTMAPR